MLTFCWKPSGIQSLLAGSATFVLASALLAPLSHAGGREGGSTVFTEADGSAWTITIRPAVKVAQAEKSSVAVPEPPEALPAVRPAVAQETVQQKPTVPAAEPPAELKAPETFDVAINAGASSATFNGRSYAEIYRSIPYNQAEYYANPGYRHDATMSILFGQPVTTPVMRGAGDTGMPPQQPRYSPYQPYFMTPSEVWAYPRPAWPYFSTTAYGFGVPTGCVIPD